MDEKRTDELDRFDLRILARVQEDALRAARSIGDEIGLSAAAVQRRIKRLRERGVIEGSGARLAPGALGAGLTAIVAVDLEREGAAELDAFRARISACGEVQQCYYVTGASDFILIVLASDLAAYEAFTRRALLSDPNVRSFTTHVVLDRVKVGLTVPIAAE